MITSAPSDLAAADVLLGQPVAERQGEDHRRDEQRLDDREPAAVECGGLEEVAGEQRHRAEQPHRLPGEPHERHRVAERDLGKVQRALLLKGCGQREQERGDQRKGRCHGTSLRWTARDGGNRAGYGCAVRYQFVDCRWSLDDAGWGRACYLEGHIPGAAFLDVERDLAAPPGARGRHPLPDAADFARAAGAAGIGPGVFVVAYGSLGGAERLWWLLRHFGHDDCAVIDLDAWRGPLTAVRGARRAGGRSSRASGAATRSSWTSSRRAATSSSSSTRGSRSDGAASRTRSTASRAGSPARSTPPGTSPCPSCRRASSSPTAARASPRASRSTACTSPAARDGSTPARGRSGSSDDELPRERG